MPQNAPFPRLCAHRGLSRACPENTLPALAAAIAVGAHEIEFDLWLSLDGVPVVCHDKTVDRTTDGHGAIPDMTWDDLRRLDAGMRLGEVWRGIRLPRLEEVLERVDGRVGLNIHIKEAGPQGRLVALVCDRLREYDLLDVAYLACGAEDVLQAALDYCPELPRACLVSSDDPARQVMIAQRYACQRVQFRRHVTAEDIRRAHDAGLLCNLFWSDDPADGRQYVANGIDVLLTNCANLMIAGGFAAAGSATRG